ncbi:hypothetical protein QYF36_013322 [Acer negundo]|nr:hypothetical protein QYF36_013322 [Acer negundo]
MQLVSTGTYLIACTDMVDLIQTTMHSDFLHVHIRSSPKLKRLWTSAQDASPDNSDPGDTAHHSLNLTKQSSSPHRFLPLTHSADKIPGVTTGENLEEYLKIYSCSSLAFLLKSKSATTSVKQLKICKCEDLGFPLDLMKGLSLESLEVDNCFSLLSFPIDKLPATLRQLKIVYCMNLKLFSQSLEIRNHDSISYGLGGDSSLPNMTSTSTLELRELEIWDCEVLQSLPGGLHNLTHLELLSLSNCSSLMYFPVGGLPNTCLKSLQISECDNLRSLPNQLNMITSLQNLTVCGCPCLMSFPEGGFAAYSGITTKLQPNLDHNIKKCM